MNTLIIDNTAQSILGANNVNNPSAIVPYKSTPDGNCLFNSVSAALFGREDFALELKVRTCIEMCMNYEFYVQEEEEQSRSLSIVCKDFKESAVCAATMNELQDIWVTRYIIQLPITSVYPFLNGLTDRVWPVLNLTLQPRLKKRS